MKISGKNLGLISILFFNIFFNTTSFAGFWDVCVSIKTDRTIDLWNGLPAFGKYIPSLGEYATDIRDPEATVHKNNESDETTTVCLTPGSSYYFVPENYLNPHSRHVDDWSFSFEGIDDPSSVRRMRVPFLKKDAFILNSSDLKGAKLELSHSCTDGRWTIECMYENQCDMACNMKVTITK